MNNCFCTIVTDDYVPYAQALHESLKKVSDIPPLIYVLVSAESKKAKIVSRPVEGIHYLFIDELCKDGTGKIIKDKYLINYMDAFRWSMKPVLINYLLRERRYEKVIFLDCDLFFFSDYNFLFDLLNSYSVLLSPHFRSSNPVRDKNSYILQFTSGIYNGGFIAANSKGTSAMGWFANVCSEICEMNPCKGQYVDQTHLNLLPVFFDDIYIIKHRGCNVANWNQLECRRVVQDDSEVLINNKFPIVFIHFTVSTIRGILSGEDISLMPYLDQYSKALRKYNPNLDIIAKSKLKGVENKKRTAKKRGVFFKLMKWLKKIG
jgi:hypothetical protein